MAAIYAGLINQYRLEYQKVFLARFDKQDEDNQVANEIELYINLNNNQNLTESDIDNIDVKSSVED